MLDDRARSIDKIRHKVGMVVQHLSLFPHGAVLTNCMLAPVLARKTSRTEAEAMAMRYLEKSRFPTRPTGFSASCQAANGSARPSTVHSSCDLKFYRSTNRIRPSFLQMIAEVLNVMTTVAAQEVAVMR